MTPERIGNAELYLGDCSEVLQTIGDRKIDVVATDPPYGRKDSHHYSSGTRKHKRYKPLAGDDQPFDPEPWLAYPKVVLWGYHCFADRLPAGTVLVWYKRKPDWKPFLSDGELAWQKGGGGVYVFSHLWHGTHRESEKGEYHHPTQKPVALWRWVLGRMKLEQGATVLDPYMGSGSCGLACAEMGLRYIGVEIEPVHYETAVNRLRSVFATS